MLSKEVKQFLARFLDLPENRVELFAQRLAGLKAANFPETGIILDLIAQIINLPDGLREQVLDHIDKRRSAVELDSYAVSERD